MVLRYCLSDKMTRKLSYTRNKKKVYHRADWWHDDSVSLPSSKNVRCIHGPGPWMFHVEVLVFVQLAGVIFFIRVWSTRYFIGIYVHLIVFLLWLDNFWTFGERSCRHGRFDG